MEKHHIDRRVAQMQAEGVVFHYGAHVGVNVAAEKLVKRSRRRRADRRRRKSRATCRCPAASSRASISPWISCRSRTGASSGETGRRQRSRSSPRASTSSSSAAAIPAPTASAPRSARARCRCTNFEIMPQPPLHENKVLTWPDWPLKLRTSSSHEEGAERDFAVMTTHVLRRERRGEEAALRARRRQDSSRSPAPNSRSTPSWCCWPWASCTRCTRACSKTSISSSIARQCRGLDRRLPHLDRQGLCRRRHAPRPVAGGVGDPRRPPGRARGRQISDGFDAVAAVIILSHRTPDGEQNDALAEVTPGDVFDAPAGAPCARRVRGGVAAAARRNCRRVPAAPRADRRGPARS